MENKRVSFIYHTGTYVSMAIVIISVLMLFFDGNLGQRILITFNLHHLIKNIIKFNEYYLLYLAAVILVLTPVAIILFFCVFYFFRKKYYLFSVSFILILTIFLMVLLKG